jgi:hypothetical protein
MTDKLTIIFALLGSSASVKLSYFNFEKFPCKFVPQVVDENSRVVKVVPQPGRVNVEESQLKEIGHYRDKQAC